MPSPLQQQLAQLPDGPGCYLFHAEDGTVLYVGKAESLRSRVRSYFQESAALGPRLRLLVERIRSVEVMVTATPVEALLLECSLIKRHRPSFNVRLRDDKQYPYIALTMKEPFPRPIVVRQARKDGNRYFGPYTSSWAMRQALRVIKAVYRLRSCSREIREGDAQRVCLDYHLGLCSAPCAGLIARAEYLRAVEEVTAFLEGRARDTLASMRREMEEAAEELRFEAAARLRDQIAAIEKVIERQRAVSTELEDQDVFALVSDGVQTCACVLQVREGRLQGQEYLFLEGAHPEELGEATRQFVEQYYARRGEGAGYPRRVLLAQGVQDRHVLEEWLTQRRNATGSRRRYRVEVAVPRRGEKRRLVELAEANARQHLEEHKSREAQDQARAEEALLALQEQLALPTPPYRIECYDISNTMGRETVAAMVVFEGGRPARAEYRKFKIRSVEGPDDYASMREVLRRRLRHGVEGDTRFGELPDLIVIDGGKGQLGAALEVERELGVEVATVGLAKQLEEVFLPGRREALLLPRGSQALFLLQRLRDEAHRFGLAYHRQLRTRRQTRSVLDSIPGIGERRRAALLRHFGSLAKVKEAPVEELARAPGMTRPAAERLHAALRGGGTPDAPRLPGE